MGKVKKSVYQTLHDINCQQYVERKGKFDYLSWPWAVHLLLGKYPAATWEVHWHENAPYFVTPLGHFYVKVSVTVEGITRSHTHPVLDNYNKPIMEPTSFHINTSIMRCLVKAIALHGLGLSIYAGEDLPSDQPAPKEPANRNQVSEAVDTVESGENPDSPFSVQDEVFELRDLGVTDEQIKATLRRAGLSVKDLKNPTPAHYKVLHAMRLAAEEEQG